MTMHMFTPTQKIVRWPIVKCPECDNPYSYFQGGFVKSFPNGKKRQVVKYLKCIKCDCEYRLECPKGEIVIENG